MDDTRLTISAFSRASRLSIKALRVYERLNLLLPVQVNEQNGYRYYSVQQLPTAHLIGLLRQVNLPLSDIQNLLKVTPDQQADVIRAYRSALTEEHRKRNALVLYILQKLQGESMNHTPFDIQTRFVEERRLGCLTRQVTVEELGVKIQEGFRHLQDFILDEQGILSGAPFVIFHGEVNVDSDGPIEICVPYQGALTPRGDIILRSEAEHYEAFVALTKEQFEFPAVLSAYDATYAYATAQGRSGPLVCREIYPYGWEVDTLCISVAEVAWPYTPRGESV